MLCDNFYVLYMFYPPFRLMFILLHNCVLFILRFGLFNLHVFISGHPNFVKLHFFSGSSALSVSPLSFQLLFDIVRPITSQYPAHRVLIDTFLVVSLLLAQAFGLFNIHLFIFDHGRTTYSCSTVSASAHHSHTAQYSFAT